MLDTEDLAETENKELSSRLESLESIVRMLELKHKNSLEHASRLEEREGELKKVRFIVTGTRWNEKKLYCFFFRNMENCMIDTRSCLRRTSNTWNEQNY